MSDTIRVTKLDAAQRQFVTALELYAEDRDPISTHTLAAAAYDILLGIYRKTREPMLFKDLLLRALSGRARKATTETLNAAQNFFKHGTHDPNAALDFNPATTDFLLFEVWHKLTRAGVSLPPIAIQFWAWFAMRYPQTYDSKDMQLALAKAAAAFAKTERREFFRDTANEPGFIDVASTILAQSKSPSGGTSSKTPA